MSEAPVEGIRLPFLTTRQRTLVARWLVAVHQLGRSDWPEVLAAFDQLHAGSLMWQGERRTFATFHERVVEDPLGQLLLEDLVAFTDPAREGPPRLATFNRQVRERLITFVSDWEEEATRYWLAYNLFWAQSFGRGYLYEVSVYADLRATGIAFEAHDLLDPIARRSPFDLEPIRKIKMQFKCQEIQSALGDG